MRTDIHLAGFERSRLLPLVGGVVGLPTDPLLRKAVPDESALSNEPHVGLSVLGLGGCPADSDDCWIYRATDPTQQTVILDFAIKDVNQNLEFADSSMMFSTSADDLSDQGITHFEMGFAILPSGLLGVVVMSIVRNANGLRCRYVNSPIGEFESVRKYVFESGILQQRKVQTHPHSVDFASAEDFLQGLSNPSSPELDVSSGVTYRLRMTDTIYGSAVEATNVEESGTDLSCPILTKVAAGRRHSVVRRNFGAQVLRYESATKASLVAATPMYTAVEFAHTFPLIFDDVSFGYREYSAKVNNAEVKDLSAAVFASGVETDADLLMLQFGDHHSNLLRLGNLLLAVEDAGPREPYLTVRSLGWRDAAQWLIRAVQEFDLAQRP